MADLTLTTFDWVPETPRGYVRDLRVRRALEEARLPYRVASVPFGDRKPAHFAHQPFGRVQLTQTRWRILLRQIVGRVRRGRNPPHLSSPKMAGYAPLTRPTCCHADKPDMKRGASR